MGVGDKSRVDETTISLIPWTSRRLRPAWKGRLRAVRSQTGDLPITRIGVVTKGGGVVLRSASGGRDLPAGYEHFR